MLIRLAFVAIVFLATGHLAAQEQARGQFHGLFRAGATASQIYGDDIGGYNKLGFTGGLGVYTPVANNLNFQLELNYAMRGSRKRPNPDQGDFTTFRLEPHYIDVPILLTGYIWKFEYEAGLCNGILIFENIDDPNFLVPNSVKIFNRYELALNLGLKVPFSDKWFGNVRFHYSLTAAAGRRAFVNGISVLGGAYNNSISFCIARRLVPQD